MLHSKGANLTQFLNLIPMLRLRTSPKTQQGLKPCRRMRSLPRKTMDDVPLNSSSYQSSARWSSADGVVVASGGLDHSGVADETRGEVHVQLVAVKGAVAPVGLRDDAGDVAPQALPEVVADLAHVGDAVDLDLPKDGAAVGAADAGGVGEDGADEAGQGRLGSLTRWPASRPAIHTPARGTIHTPTRGSRADTRQ
ncbi:hypothetical protein C8035_v005065 [Colletotrichum spinosum]|uniref:Uncharacterized protein n=1 Tax=Colletotrichum spinosum TaxID=1347390 RepID=A0A4R8QDB0_9PEZI|nr:hypothetical protein C8035_v005065 [Colletotrichum spinosum]